MKEVVEEVTKEWEMPESKVRVIVIDNGSNVVAVFKSFWRRGNGNRRGGNGH